MKKMIFIKSEKCLSCRTCEVECTVAHSNSKKLEEAIYEQPQPQKRIYVEQIDKITIPLQCRHCSSAPCIKVCPTKAMSRENEDSPVLINPNLCIGCKYCILVCPFGIITESKHGKAIIKCDLCIERLQKGQIPACADSCPTKAIKFEETDEISDKKRKEFLVEFIK